MATSRDGLMRVSRDGKISGECSQQIIISL